MVLKLQYICYNTLQENNAIAKVDLANLKIEGLYPLGSKDWLQFNLDASDQNKGK